MKKKEKRNRSNIKNLRKCQKTENFDKKLLIKKIGTPDGDGVNTKVVDIDKIYVNMHYRTDST